jgi:hypothetical protein
VSLNFTQGCPKKIIENKRTGISATNPAATTHSICSALILNHLIQRHGRDRSQNLNPECRRAKATSRVLLGNQGAVVRRKQAQFIWLTVILLAVRVVTA